MSRTVAQAESMSRRAFRITTMIAPDVKLLTHREAARRLGLTPKQLAGRASNGHDPRPVVIGGTRFYKVADVQRVAAQTPQPPRRRPQNVRHMQPSTAGKRESSRCR